MPQDQEKLFALLEQIQRRDQAALGSFYDATIGYVFNIAFKTTSNHALSEEIVSDVFMQVWRTAKQFDAERASPLSWLLMITRSRAIDALRREQRVTREQMPLAEDYEAEDVSTPNPLNDTLRIEENTELFEALKLLDERQRQMIALAFYRGMSHQEIADYIKEPLGTVKTVLRRSQSILRGALTKPNFVEGGYDG